MLSYIAFAFLALVLGFKHSYDADHLIAVSNVLRKIKSLKSAVKAGFSWAMGHMMTAAIVTILIYAFGQKILNAVHFEKVVAIMLIIIGVLSLKSVFQFHSHIHKHGDLVHSHPHLHTTDENHVHKHMFGIGIIHGLASNDEILMLLTASLGVSTLGGVLLGVGIFSIGVILGMILFSCIFLFPILKLNNDKVHKFISCASGLIGIAYGALLILM